MVKLAPAGEMTMRMKISDYRLCRYLVASGISFTGITRDPLSNRVTFDFPDELETRRHLQDYRYSNPEVPVHNLEMAEARLKSVIFFRDSAGG